MAAQKRVEIHCPGCGKDTLLVREPRYEGFARVGESLRCAACGHPFDSEADVPFRGRAQEKVFTSADRSAPVEVFEAGEADRLCRHCTHYIVNPFMQWCGLHRKEVEATDTCDRFEPRPPPPPDEDPGKPPSPPLL